MSSPLLPVRWRDYVRAVGNTRRMALIGSIVLAALTLFVVVVVRPWWEELAPAPLQLRGRLRERVSRASTVGLPADNDGGSK